MNVVSDLVGGLNVTEKAEGKYWHIYLSESEQGDVVLMLPKRGRTVSLAQYAVQLDDARS